MSLSAADATELIWKLAKSPSFKLVMTVHARERLLERGLINSDLLHVLKNGHVVGEGMGSTRPGYHKYQINSLTPNSERRQVGVVCIPCSKDYMIKIVTIMWIDETATKAGSILDENDE